MLEYAIVYLFGLGLAVLANVGIYRLAYFARSLGPYSAPPTGMSPRTFGDRLPILGWWFLRREAPVHGPRYWLRPLLIELLFPLAIVALYHWELEGNLMPHALMRIDKSAWVGTFRIQACIHIVLATFLLIATFIDFDERSIPDSVTVVGALVGLVGAAIFPHWHLLVIGSPQGEVIESLQPASPDPFRLAWYGTNGLQLALLNYGIWCFALADRRLILRKGLSKAVEYFFAGLVRHSSWKTLLGIWTIGSLAIVVAYATLPDNHWQSLFSSILGMTLGCAIVWGVRIAVRLAIGVEALGFGDVTLMAMVGVYLGWQPVWLAFFIGPVIGILFVVLAWMFTGDRATPFGPYLAAGSMVLVVGWGYFWDSIAVPRLASVGTDIIFWLFAGIVIMMGTLMWLIHQLKRLRG